MAQVVHSSAAISGPFGGRVRYTAGVATTDDLAQALLGAAKKADPAMALARLARSHEARVVLRFLAGLQDGQFAATQAWALDLSPGAITWLVTSGEAMRIRRGVLRFTSAPGDPDPAVAAWLACWPHGVICRRSAAVHHGLRSVTSPRWTEITLPFGIRLRPGGVTVYRTRSLPPGDRVLVGGVTYTSLARTVVDLADGADPWGTLALLDDAVARGAKPGWIHSVATRLRNGRPGVRLLVDATAPGGAEVFRSFLERASAHVYRAAHLPEPEWNVPVHDRLGLIGIVDALWRPWHVVSEKEGLRFHTTPEQRRADAERFNRLLDASYDPRRFTWEDVVRRPVYVAATIARALATAGADVDLAAIPSRIEVPVLDGTLAQRG
jgi:hypothetical protein